MAITTSAPEPFIAILPADDLDLGNLVDGFQRTVDQAPGDAPLIALVFGDSAPSMDAHSRRIGALTAVIEDAATRRAPQTRVVGITPGFPAPTPEIITEALTDAIAMATETGAMTGQVLVVTPVTPPAGN